MDYASIMYVEYTHAHLPSKCPDIPLRQVMSLLQLHLYELVEVAPLRKLHHYVQILLLTLLLKVVLTIQTLFMHQTVIVFIYSGSIPIAYFLWLVLLCIYEVVTDEETHVFDDVRVFQVF